MGYAFRSDIIRSVFSEAVRQGFHPENKPRSNGHVYIRCPQCRRAFWFTMSGRGMEHQIHNRIAELRRHGFVWQGRGGDHTAPIPVGSTKR